MNYRILPGARRDIDRAEARLEGEHPGYGVAFLLEVRDAIRAVLAQPLMHPRTPDGPRRVESREYFIRRFNYRVLYVIDGDDVLFFAVHHAARPPGTWRHRTRDLP